MEVVVLLCVLYFVPLIVNFIIVYRDEDVRTIGDFIEFSWAVFLPICNLFISLVFFISYLPDKINLVKYWNKFLNIKIK